MISEARGGPFERIAGKFENYLGEGMSEKEAAIKVRRTLLTMLVDWLTSSRLSDVRIINWLNGRIFRGCMIVSFRSREVH